MSQKHPDLDDQGYTSPGVDQDCLYCTRCDPSRWWWILWTLWVWLWPLSRCGLCEDGQVRRPLRRHQNPVVHYGTIASGNQVIKDGRLRDRLGQKFGAMCVEMEAAGLVNSFPCLVVRGICDYADRHKNDGWQKYAATTTAAYAKWILEHITPQQTTSERRIAEVVGMADHLQDILSETKQQHVREEVRYQDEKHRRCHQVFKTSTYEQFKDDIPGRVEGTCQWVLTHPQYCQWLQIAHDDLLWISADPGCGKSVLTKSLVDNELQDTDSHTVCYFFFKDNEEQDSLTTALCALLHQLFSHQPRLIHHAVPAWERMGNKLRNEVAELWRILLAAARDDQAHDVTCVLDALDECRHVDRRVLIDKLASFYTDTSRASADTRRGRLRFLVTSRPYDDIQVQFQKTLADLFTIRLRGEEENDPIHDEIDLVIRIQVAQLAVDRKLNNQTKERLEATLLGMQHRTYLWLYLAVEGIHETYRYSLRPEETLITSLPVSVGDGYEKILSRVNREKKRHVYKILQIVVGARRPLMVAEMAIALGIATRTESKSTLSQVQLDPCWLRDSIRDWCGLFVFINHDRIYLIHQTAKEFLISNSSSATSLSGWKHCLNLQGTEREMTRICTEFLYLRDVWSTAPSLIQQYQEHQRRVQRADDILNIDDYVQSFLQYSAEHWPSHLREACLPQDYLARSQILTFYQVEGRLHKVWFPIFWNATRPYDSLPEMSAIRLGALLGHETILELMIRGNEDVRIDASDKDGRTALVWASECGHTKVVQILLDEGADIDAQGEYGNALYAASYSGHEEVVQILLDAGAKVNAQGGECGNALQAASFRGHEEVVQILLDAGANVLAQEGFYGSALQAASWDGHAKVVELLLDAGADVNAQGGEYGNALYAASALDEEKVVQILLDAGAKVNAEGGECGNALQAASWGGNEKVVQLLLQAGADINAQGGLYGNALQAASYGGRVKVVQMLLEAGADVNAEGRYGNAL